MSLTTTRIVQLAHTESERVARSRSMQVEFARRGELIGAEVPTAYFAMTQGLMEGVNRFNESLNVDFPGLRLHYRETPGVTLREVIPGHDLLASVWRKDYRFDLILRFMTRATGPDLPLIEGHGIYPRKDANRVLLRIEGWVEGGKMTYWVSLDFKRRPVPLGDLPGRIVLSVAKEDPEFLHCDLFPKAPPSQEEPED